jgi:hypothetical protein
MKLHIAVKILMRLRRPHIEREECAVKSVHACPKLNPYSL